MTKKLVTVVMTVALILGSFGGAWESLLSRPGEGSVPGLAFAQQPPSGATPPATGATPPAKGGDHSGIGAPDTRPKMPLTLKQAIEAALANNLDVAIRKLDPASARYGVTQSDAAFDPLLAANASYGESKSEPQSSFQPSSSKLTSADISISETLKQGFHYTATWRSFKAEQPSLINPISPYYNSSLGLALVQPLLKNFGFEANETQLEISKLDVSTTEEGFRSTVIATLENVEDAYWELLASMFNFQNQVASLKLADDLLDLNRKKVEVGTLAPIQITEAEASVAAREQGVILAEASIRNAEDNLRRIMNIAPDSPDWDMAIDPTDKPASEGENPDLDKMIEAALANRPEIAQAKNTVHVQDLNYRFAQNQRRPVLDAVGGYAPSGNNYQYKDINGDGTIDSLELNGWSDSASEVFQNHNYDWNVGVNFAIPIGNRNAKATEARTKIALEQSQMSLENIQRNIQVEVRIAVRSVITFEKSVEAARSNVNLQEKKLDAEQKRYDNGMSTSFEVLSFQSDLTSARSALIAAISAYNKSIAALGRATALLPEMRGVTIAKP